MRVGIFIDGGFFRALAHKAGLMYTPDLIEEVALSCVEPGETLLRVLYYDCEPFHGTVKLPISGKEIKRAPDRSWLKDLASRPLLAVRLGTVRNRGFVLRARGGGVPKDLADGDFDLDIQQKGVDMRLGIDIVMNALRRSFDRIILVCGDIDCLPATRVARREGLQVVMVDLPGARLVRELRWHSDFVRPVDWPKRFARHLRSPKRPK